MSTKTVVHAKPASESIPQPDPVHVGVHDGVLRHDGLRLVVNAAKVKPQQRRRHRVPARSVCAASRRRASRGRE